MIVAWLSSISMMAQYDYLIANRKVIPAVTIFGYIPLRIITSRRNTPL